MRIAVGQVWQETNTLNPIRTTRADFEDFGVVRGSELLDRMAHTNELGGFIQSIRNWVEPAEILGLVRLPAWPSGTATSETFDWILYELMSSLERAMPLDGLLLALHGSMAAKGHADVEGELLQAVRNRIGPALPLVATLDLHANVTPLMARHADALVLYHTAPHVDVFETGTRGAELMRRILYEGAVPQMAYLKVPAVFPVERANTQAAKGVSVDLMNRLQALERDPRILAAGVATVQPWLDIPELGSAAIVVSDDAPELAHAHCRAIAGEMWSRRREYLSELFNVEPAVARAAKKHSDGLVVLSDPADATTSGAPGDSCWILAELLRHEWSRPVLTTLVAPHLVQQAEQLGVGAAFHGNLGGVRDSRFGNVLPFEGTVSRIFDGRFVLNGHLGRNLSIDMGRCAVLCRGQVVVIITTRSGPHFAPELFQAAGYDPFSAAVVVARSPCGFRAAYESRAVEILSVRAPGCAPPDFWQYPFKSIPHPLWPWDDFHWEA